MQQLAEQLRVLLAKIGRYVRNTTFSPHAADYNKRPYRSVIFFERYRVTKSQKDARKFYDCGTEASRRPGQED
ncbi:hypothetical protein F442_06058 [Phytophthora nicotianae P10297]|uniref:Uncharacterized protein n=2 Tax=Phytophthora nicotianae TaxID=4792 RepID=W2ZMG6_PHYNI|nr:hypothetical protein F444_06077 [Phytophthora nicotianae P1976]ETP48171.1 hypothetical protein F442_06058 [Phytophthora nicotianae P10297]